MPPAKPEGEMTAKADSEMAALLQIKLPPLPNAALRVAELSRSANTSVSTIADTIGYDPQLAARILRAANSPLYTRERHINTLTRAVNVLGMRTLNQLVISYAASSLFTTSGTSSFLERMLWKHSVFVGLAAREINLRFNLHGSEEAFLSGLLHDIGKALLIRQNPELYAPLAEITDEKRLLEMERKRYGFTHPRISALVVKHWGLPPEFSDPILSHHAPDEATYSLLIARCLSVANKLANMSGFSICSEGNENSKDVEADESVFLLGLSADNLTEIREKAEQSMSEMLEILSN